ncbi:unnamed protein product [Urochloa decumbens]|uniref:Uncharacterized protein n=1 Tax=Urochloa decumbens TaxID=240449 RepID=A0ABC9GC62_9POAL
MLLCPPQVPNSPVGLALPSPPATPRQQTRSESKSTQSARKRSASAPVGLLPMDGAAAAAGGNGEPAANGSKSEGQQFDPSRMIGIIKRKALIKDLAAAYHAECIASCKELLQLQRKWEEEQYVEAKIPEEPRSLMMKSSKHRKK